MSVESVWDYPRPPRVEPSARHIVIVHAGITIADTSRAMRLLETSHPPTYYIPQADLAMHLLSPAPQRRSFCEFKGIATYWNLQNGEEQLDDVAWSYASPTPRYAGLKDHLAFYASRGRRMHCGRGARVATARRLLRRLDYIAR